ncbi:hypothetical protein NC652_028856 [Populus alba x Populus x berolinensis]|nr:hypothetical protein NC652_028856 [Populus alba x Populus x berolinensis]
MGFSQLCLSQSLSFILSLFHFHSTISSPLSSNHSSSSSSHLCAHHQSLSLLQFKQSFSINRSASLEYCQYPFPKIESWIDSTDCCSWDGVTCDMKTGHTVTEEGETSCHDYEQILELGSYNKSVTINPTISSWVNHVTDYSSIGLLYPFTATLVLVDVPRTLCKSDWDNALGAL